MSNQLSNYAGQQRPTASFVFASWAALIAGVTAYAIGLWNATMHLSEKGYYFTLIMYGLFAAVSLQKTMRDKLEGQSITGMYVGLCWGSLICVLALLTVGLWNASLALSEKGFYAMAFLLSLFSITAVQKNVRDLSIGETSIQRGASETA